MDFSLTSSAESPNCAVRLTWVSLADSILSSDWLKFWVEEVKRLRIEVISPSDSCVLLDKVRTSVATTAKPLPCSPARAASIAAFKASKLVCSEISRIEDTIEDASLTESSKPSRDWRLCVSVCIAI